jgi:hypothetical protein
MKLRTLVPFVVTYLFATAITLGADAPRPLPPGIKGFDGTLGGKVVSVQPDGAALVMKVTDVLNVNQKSTAKAPKSVVGKEVTVTPQMTKGKDGKMYPQPRHANFIQSLKPGQDVQVDCATADGQTLEITILTRSEKKAAEKQADREKKESQKRAD